MTATSPICPDSSTCGQVWADFIERLKEKAFSLLYVLKDNPFQNPPPYEKLIGDLQGYYSRRINIQHRLVYQVIEAEKTVKVIPMWTHYES